MDEFDVAVVVFCRAVGVDERDAESRAQAAVQQTLLNAELFSNRLTGQSVQAAGVMPLSAASSSGYLRTVPGPLAYKYAGLTAPQKGVDA
jgi:hypothetical protein